MATELGSVQTFRGEMFLTRFWGGESVGVALQLTQGPGSILGQGQVGHIQLSVSDCHRLQAALRLFLQGASFSPINAPAKLEGGDK